MPKIMTIAEFNQDAHMVLSKTQPKLLQAVEDAINLHQTPEQIERFVLRRCPKHSVLPCLCRGAAEYLYQAKSN